MKRWQKWLAKVALGLDVKSLNGQKYALVNGKLAVIPDDLKNYIKEGYNINDIVYSAVNVQLDKVRLAPWSLWKVVDEGSLKMADSFFLNKEYKKSRDFRHKALEPIKNPGKWGELLKYPNDEDSFNDFVADGCGYKLLTGNTMIWADILDGGANKGVPHQLWNMPTQHVQIKVIGSWPQKVVGYDLTLMGLADKKVFTPEEVLHTKYKNYDIGINGEGLWGTAPLKAALRKINRNNAAVDAAAAKFQNGGLDAIIYVDEPEGVLSRETAWDQANAIKSKLINEYTGPKNQGKIATSGYKMGVANLGLSPVELAIIESEKFDQVGIASIYGVPPELIGYTGTKTYNNIKEAEIALTTRCALPLLTSFRDKLNNHAKKYWGLDKGHIIDFDPAVFTELQEGVGEKMKWVEPLANITGLPANRILDLLELERIEEPEYDMPRITQQMGQFLDEWRLNDVDKVLNGNLDNTGNEEDV